jgi:hypothetical protein
MELITSLKGIAFQSKYQALVIFTVFWTFVLLVTGTITSGFHFIDDHELIRMDHDLDNGSFGSVASDWILRDFALRFRPFYYLHRVISVQIFGDNFVLFSLQNLVLLILTSWLLFLTFRNLRFSTIQSLGFSFLSLVGTQAAIWWRLGPNETIGIFVFSLSLYFLTKSYIVERGRLYFVSSFVFMFFATLSKESFIMMVPLYVFLNFLLYWNKYKVGILKNIWENKLFNFLWLVILGIEAYIVMVVVGTNKIGYAGADSESLGLRRILGTIKSLITQLNWQLVVYLAVLCGALFLYRWFRKRSLPRYQLKLLLLTAFVFIISVVPQGVIYAKSGVYERYLIPGSLAVAFVSTALFFISVSLVESRMRKQILTVLIVGIALYTSYAHVKATVNTAEAFTLEGVTLNSALKKLDENISGDDILVIAAEPANNFEQGYSLKYYLQYVLEHSNFYYYPISLKSTSTKFEQGLSEGFVSFLNVRTTDDLENESNAKAVWIFAEVEELFLQHAVWFNAEDYTREQFGLYVVYTRN